MRRPLLLPKTDLYFAKAFLGYFLLVLLGTVSLVILADVFQKGDDFLEFAGTEEGQRTGHGMVLLMMLKYYASFAPGLVLRYMLPLVMLLAAIITVTISSMHNEYTVLRASGISIQRALVPLFVPALVIGYAFELTRDAYLPDLVRAGHRVMSRVRPRDSTPLSLVIRDGTSIQTVSMGHFDQEGAAHNLLIEQRAAQAYESEADPTATVLQGTGAGQAPTPDVFEAWSAQKAYLQPYTPMDLESEDPETAMPHEWKWVPAQGQQLWRYRRPRQRQGEWLEPIPTLITPAILERQVLGEDIMTRSDLQLLQEEEMDARIELWRRAGEPWACVALLLLGLSLTLRRAVRGIEPNYIQNMAMAVFLAGGFMILRSIFGSMGESETLPVGLAVAMPILIYAAIGGWVFHRLGR